eukprot:scpid15132/ scgid3936/ E3 ubiquitin-protein ligase SHPRH; SNF2, histone-linker, PHD and RING finger domain-containing helicase
MEEVAKRKHEEIESSTCHLSAATVDTSGSRIIGQDKKPRPGNDARKQPTTVTHGVFAENIMVWLMPANVADRKGFWGIPIKQHIGVSRRDIPEVQFKSIKLEFRLVAPSATDGVLHLLIENRTRCFQHTYAVAKDNMLLKLSNMHLMLVAPTKSEAWIQLLQGKDSNELNLPVEIYATRSAFVNADKLNHGSFHNPGHIVRPYALSRYNFNPLACYFTRLVDNAHKDILDRCELLNKQKLTLFCKNPEGVYTYVSDLSKESASPDRYPTTEEVRAQELNETQHPNLLPRLRGYQQRAVRWMLHQERHGSGTSDAGSNGVLHPLWKEFRSESGHTLYLNPYSWRMTRHRFPAWHMSGGILADEMGLGKTVEVLATILCNPYTLSDPVSRQSKATTGSSAQALVAPGPTVNGAATSQPPTPSGTTSAMSIDLASESCTNASTTSLKDVTNIDAPSHPPTAKPSSCASWKASDDTANEHANAGNCLCNEKIEDSQANCSEHVFCVRCNGWQHKACVYFKTKLPNGDYICPQCYASRDPMPCKTTLIISPSQISGQWLDEVKLHSRPGTFKWLNYTGVANGYLNPSELAEYDIIVTTYHVLTLDLSHAVLKFGQDDRPRRHKRRYIAMPSPLIGLKFWRICLDEAQMVENTNAKAAQMANKLAAVHRWCVTGTPINRGLDDLYGLLYFLNAWPYCVQGWWKDAAYDPYCNGHTDAMHGLLSNVMWRTAKKDVEHELGIPDQTVSVEMIKFKPVEREYYQRQLEDCSEHLYSIIKRHKLKNVHLRDLDRRTTASLMHPLLALRQSCDHPQAVRTGNWALVRRQQHREVLSMSEVLDQLIAKALKECIDANQAQIIAVNGVAALYAVQEEWENSAKSYVASLQLVEERASLVATDTVLRLHATYNLQDVIRHCDKRPSDVPSDESLVTMEKALRSHYMMRCEEAVSATDQSRVSEVNWDPYKKVHKFPTWHRILIDELVSADVGYYVVNKCLQAVSQDHLAAHPIGFDDIGTLKAYLADNLKRLENAWLAVYTACEMLRSDTSEDTVSEARDCHLQPAVWKDGTPGVQAPRCRFCKLDDLMSVYESELYVSTINLNAGAGGDDHAVQTWADGPTELIIRCLHRLCRDKHVRDGLVDKHFQHSLDELAKDDFAGQALLQAQHEQFKLTATEKDFFCAELLETAQCHVQLFEQRKKEFKCCRNMWKAMRDRVGAQDELRMATTRIYGVDSAEVAEKDPFAVHRPAVKLEIGQMGAERAAADTKYKRAVGRLLYLQNLSKADNGMNQDTCPICCKVFGVEWQIYACGHCFCMQCVDSLLIGKSRTNGKVACPMCRLVSQTSEIKCVTVPRKDTTLETGNIKGGLSCKLAAVVRTVMDLYKKDKAVKCLIFSNWNEVLSLISHGLALNGIKHASLMDKAGTALQTTLRTFRQDPSVTALCLHLRTAGNGLNLIEATHVLLVEPSLKPALEMQAIGRVHRVGQTKKTYVHRFLVEGSVEERLYQLLGNQKTSSSLLASPTKKSSGEDECADMTVDQLQQIMNPDLLPALNTAATTAAAAQNTAPPATDAVGDDAE